MKTKKKKYLPLYEKWMETGLIGRVGFLNGLCNSIELKKCDTSELLSLFTPTERDLKKLESIGFSTAYWGSGKKKDQFGNDSEFTPLRQNMILFMAAMNDEL